MASRHTTIARAVGLAGGIVVAAAVAAALGGEFGRGPMLVPMTFGFVVVAAVAGAETFVKPPAGPRTASLTPRRVIDYLPRRLSVVVGALLALLVCTMTLTTLTASEDATLGGHRVIACASALVGSATGPYAGSYYTGKLAWMLVALLAVVALAARQVVLRPRGVVPAREDDDAVRRSSMTALVLALGTALGATQAGIAFVSSGAMLRLDGCEPAWTTPVGWALLVSAVASAAVALLCLARLLLHAPVQALAGQR